MALKIIASEITDTRHLEKLLVQHQFDYRIIRESMASAGARENFRQLSQQHDWHKLPMVFDDDTFLGGELELQAWLQQKSPVDRLSLSLTLLGLLPFIAGTWATLAQPGSLIASMLPYYGWVILSFMAGTLWGQSSAFPRIRLLSVSFPLLAWPGLIYLGPSVTPLALAALFLALLPIDHWLFRKGKISASYWRLRRAVTLVVVLCQAILMTSISLGNV